MTKQQKYKILICLSLLIWIGLIVFLILIATKVIHIDGISGSNNNIDCFTTIITIIWSDTKSDPLQQSKKRSTKGCRKRKESARTYWQKYC